MSGGHAGRSCPWWESCCARCGCVGAGGNNVGHRHAVALARWLGVGRSPCGPRRGNSVPAPVRGRSCPGGPSLDIPKLHSCTAARLGARVRGCSAHPRSAAGTRRGGARGTRVSPGHFVGLLGRCATSQPMPRSSPRVTADRRAGGAHGAVLADRAHGEALGDDIPPIPTLPSSPKPRSSASLTIGTGGRHRTRREHGARAPGCGGWLRSPPNSPTPTAPAAAPCHDPLPGLAGGQAGRAGGPRMWRGHSP